MRFAVFLCLACLTACSPAHKSLAGDPVAVSENQVANDLLKQGVLIRVPNHVGSGFIVNRGEYSYVLTAAHVVQYLRTETKDPRTNKPLVQFADAKVVQIIEEEGRIVGESSFDAEVIRYSDAWRGEDLALLRVRKSNAFKSSTSFYLDKKLPPVGAEGFHVGCPYGEIGTNSLIPAFLSHRGRLLKDQPSKVVYDQFALNGWGGSSGGLIALKDGRIIGMVVRGGEGGFMLAVPVRRMLSWAERAGVSFIFDPSVKLPSDQELRRYPIDETACCLDCHEDH